MNHSTVCEDADAPDNVTEISRGVLVTGASSGIGAASALLLARNGYRVFAGVRRIDDGAKLVAEGGERIRPVVLDVTIEEQVTAAREHVEKECGSLAGVVNNAGIAIGGPLEFVRMEDLRTQLEINVIGVARVTQAFLPLLRKARGRIVNISSIAGRNALPLMAPYSASKFALEAMSDALRVELWPWGIRVILIEPGAVITPIWGKSQGFAEASPEAERLYGKLLAMGRRVLEGAGKDGLPVDEVARKVFEAISSKNPKARYLMGRGTRARVVLEHLPTGIRDRLIARQVWK